MLVLSWRAFEDMSIEQKALGELDYCWENFFIRLWLFRTSISTLTKIPHIQEDANRALETFDGQFVNGGIHQLKAIRNMIEHFDDYAAGKGRGPAERDKELDPWRTYDIDRYERGRLSFSRLESYQAAIDLNSAAKEVSKTFISWYKSETGKPSGKGREFRICGFPF